jgi:hypothetical protein
MIMKFAMMRIKADWDAMLAALEFLNWESGARLANIEWMRLRCDAWGDGIHVVAVVCQQGCESWGGGDHILDEAETYCIDGIEEGKDFEVDFGGYTEEGNCFGELLPCFTAGGTLGRGIVHSYFL